MNENKPNQTETSPLFSKIGKHSEQYLLEIEQDLQQMNLLMQTVVVELSAHFIGLQNILAERDKLYADLNNKHSFSEINQKKMLFISKKVKLHSEGAVTAIQFEDMTRQINERTIGRVKLLKRFMSSLSSLNTGSLEENNALLLDCESLIKEIEADSSKSVVQTKIESGDIELF